MSLANSLSKFRSEISDAAARNAQYSRPPSNNSASRSSNSKGSSDNNKRAHDVAFAPAPTTVAPAGHAGTELLTQVFNAVKYLKDKESKLVTFDNLIGYLSLPNDAQKNIPLIKRALMQHERVDYISKAESGMGKEGFRYRPIHPVTNAEELKSYLAIQPTAQGIPVKDLKDGWPDCVPAIDQLEREGFLLVARNKKDNAPRTVWPDSPTYHILNSVTQMPQKVDAEFVEVWAKTKLPASEIEIRNELERAGLVPTSQVKEVKRFEVKRKEKRRINRKGGKTTNSHMLGILKDYSKK